MEKPKSCSRFQDSWLQMEEFSWVARGKNSSYANCKLCAKEIDLKSMGRQALKSHASGKIHQSRVNGPVHGPSCLEMYFKYSKKIQVEGKSYVYYPNFPVFHQKYRNPGFFPVFPGPQNIPVFPGSRHHVFV